MFLPNVKFVFNPTVSFAMRLQAVKPT